MPTRDEIPDRYPVLEHMERRLHQPTRFVRREPATRRVGTGLVGLMAGGTLGGLLLGVFLAYLESQP